jgi:hypothetical protein
MSNSARGCVLRFGRERASVERQRFDHFRTRLGGPGSVASRRPNHDLALRVDFHGIRIRRSGASKRPLSCQPVVCQKLGRGLDR